MTDVVYANSFTIQINDTVRLICQDVRGGVQNPGANFMEQIVICRTVGELILSHENARALRDLLVEQVKDPMKSGEMN